MAYDWDGMIKIEFKEALKMFFDGQEVFLLYADGTEGLAMYFADMTQHNLAGGEFGYER